VTDPVLVVLGGVVVKTAVRLWVGPNVLADAMTHEFRGVDEGERNAAVTAEQLEVSSFGQTFYRLENQEVRQLSVDDL
jgi:hypothetical protein